jgi:hypothetical protein
MRKFFTIGFLTIVPVFLSGCALDKNQKNLPATPSPIEAVKILKEGEGPQVNLLPAANKQSVTLKIASISADIKKIDYEIVYDTNGVQRGVLGTFEIKEGQDKIVKEILLASCSKNVCVYDKNVSKLQLTMKFLGEGELFEYQKEFSL